MSPNQFIVFYDRHHRRRLILSACCRLTRAQVLDYMASNDLLLPDKMQLTRCNWKFTTNFDPFHRSHCCWMISYNNEKKRDKATEQRQHIMLFIGTENLSPIALQRNFEWTMTLTLNERK